MLCDGLSIPFIIPIFQKQKQSVKPLVLEHNSLQLKTQYCEVIECLEDQKVIKGDRRRSRGYQKSHQSILLYIYDNDRRYIFDPNFFAFCGFLCFIETRNMLGLFMWYQSVYLPLPCWFWNFILSFKIFLP